MVYNLYKKRGETPLECLERFKKANPELKDEKMTYLGRLDPLAEGVLLVGSGEDTEQKHREEFFGLDKEYEFAALFGFTTDTYDVMGKVLKIEKVEKMNEMDLIKIAKIYEGEREQKYPEYSSKMISKKTSPLTPLQRRGEKQKINIFSTPSLWEGVGGWVKKITIYKLQFNGLTTLNNKELFGRLLMDISKVNGDFRQHEILTLWKQILLDHTSKYNNGHCNFFGKFSAHVSSGTYIRSLVNDIGSTLGVGATTLSIKRIRVGDYKIEDSIKLF